jgi:hypothetical protein
VWCTGRTMSGADLLPQQLEPPLRFKELGTKSLESNIDAQLEIEGLPHLAHPAAAQHLEDLVPLTEDLP